MEDALVGVTAGAEKTIDVTFPDAYPAAHLAGKPATFDVTVKEVAEPEALVLDDEFAKRLGLESMENLRAVVKRQIESEYGQATRQKVKRQLLDQLDAAHAFANERSEAYDVNCANQAWERMLSFLGKTLK